MKKLLVAVLACALVAPAFAAIENVKVTGEVTTLGVLVEPQGAANASVAIGNVKGASNRLFLGIGADLVEDVAAKITLAHRWVNGANRFTGEDLNTFQGTTFIAEGFLTISNVFDTLEVKVGRQFYGEETSAVMYFGPTNGYAITNDYNSVDGATVAYNSDHAALTLAYLTTVANPLTMAAVNEVNIAGADGILKLNDQVGLQAYIYDQRQRAGAAGANFGFFGAKPTIETDVFKASAEIAKNYGDVHGWLIKADVALPLEMGSKLVTPHATFIKTNKTFQAYGNYRAGLMFGLVGAVPNGLVIPGLGVTDRVVVFNAGLCVKPADEGRVGFGFDFYRARVNGQFSGNSWEAKVIYAHNDYVSFDLTGALLTGVGQKLKESPTAVQVGMNVKF